MSLGIHYLHFVCDGCKAEWSLHVDPTIETAKELKAWLDAGKMGSCPKNCGAKTCSVKFRLPQEASR